MVVLIKCFFCLFVFKVRECYTRRESGPKFTSGMQSITKGTQLGRPALDRLKFCLDLRGGVVRLCNHCITVFAYYTLENVQCHFGVCDLRGI